MAIAITFLFVSAACVQTPAWGQIDTSYMVEVDSLGDSTCFYLIGDSKIAVDCGQMFGAPNTGAAVPDPPVAADEKPTVLEFLKNAWAWILANIAILLLIAEAVVRLTPTEKDNNILRIVQSWLDKLLPNRKKGGGTFVAFEERGDAPSIAAVGRKTTKEVK